MYTKELFHETVGILVKAYLNDTLVHGNCAACAVGNIIQSRMGIKNPIGWYPSWYMKYVNGHSFTLTEYEEAAKKEISSTGYSIEDTLKIESAFESAPGDNKEDSLDPAWTFNGLMAVVDVLCEIHGMNEEEKKESKALFVKV